MMYLLPRKYRQIRSCGPGNVCVGAYLNHASYICWIKMALDDLPNDLVSIDDLERVGVDIVHSATVRQVK